MYTSLSIMLRLIMAKTLILSLHFVTSGLSLKKSEHSFLFFLKLKVFIKDLPKE